MTALISRGAAVECGGDVFTSTDVNASTTAANTSSARTLRVSPGCTSGSGAGSSSRTIVPTPLPGATLGTGCARRPRRCRSPTSPMPGPWTRRRLHAAIPTTTRNAPTFSSRIVP